MSKSEQIASEVLQLAKAHEHLGSMVSSAKLCVEDATSLFDEGKFADCRNRAIKSLQYSVGVFSPVYKTAMDLSQS